MKKTILTILLLAFCVSISGAGITDKLRAVIAAKNAAAPGGDSCPGDATELVGFSSLNADFYSIGYESAEIYVGQTNFDPGDTDVTICSVDIYMHITGGSGNTIQVEIFPMSGNNLGIAGANCVSDSIVMTTDNDLQVHSFGGMSCLLDNTKLYAITIARTDHSYDASNYSAGWAGDIGSWSGQYGKWDVSGVSDGTRSVDYAMDLNGF